LILLLFLICTEAIGRILQPYQPWSWSCWSYRDQNNFCVKQWQAQFPHYLPDHAFPDKATVLGSHIITFGYVRLALHLENPLCWWSRVLQLNEECLRVTNPLLSKKTFPNFHGRCATTICFHNLWKDCLQLLALCPCWAYFPWKFNISEWNLAVYWNVSV
jgi:hypothetical protein